MPEGVCLVETRTLLHDVSPLKDSPRQSNRSSALRLSWLPLKSM